MDNFKIKDYLIILNKQHYAFLFENLLSHFSLFYYP